MPRRRRPPMRLNPEALWDRLALLEQSQAWLAQEAGISPSYLSMLISGERAPSGRVRHRILNVLQMGDVHELFTMEAPDDAS